VESDVDFTSDDDRLICTSEAAAILGLTRWGVRWLVRGGRLVAEKKLDDGQLIFDRRKVQEIARARAIVRACVHDRAAGPGAAAR
jgi:hypothetical protein